MAVLDRYVNNIQAQNNSRAFAKIRQLNGTGAPTAADGATFAGPGSSYIDRVTGFCYVNVGTLATPAWQKVTTA